MSNDYAVVWNTDKGYFPGTNASLNAWEFYGNEADIFILTWTDFLTREYKDEWPHVSFSLLDRQLYPKRSAAWYLRFMDFDFALRGLFDSYKAILFWSADQCFVNNVMDFFEIAHKTGRPILGTNEHGSYHRDFRHLTEKPYKHTWNVPYTDQPVFIPSSDVRLIQELMKLQVAPCEVSRMDGLNYTARSTKTRVIEVPGELWIQNVPHRIPLREHERWIFVHDSSTQLYAFHRRYWNQHICHSYLPGNDERTQLVGKQNKLLFNRMYNFFNRDCRVKWTEGLEVWDGR